ncbi:hypothetical protein [Methylobacterium sp. GXS13]|uniref:hypothetical protein n=1 Tax=Methylobacterium sp. GXS13 TaxID=1730094 RepID=UPI00128ED09F|nr:hypothetical protein [Methylobacterium sp. GXS13]
MRGALWVAALALCCFSAVMLAKANRPVEGALARPATGDPVTTGSINQAPIRWCGAAPWCR